VEQPSDVTLIERTKEFKGRYHVLHGVLNPLEGIGPQDLKLRELISRMSDTDEIIIALNPTVEGEVTAQYLSKMIKPLDVKVRKIASGIPMGHQLEFSDDATLARAIHGATEL
jgi:recombination protein RecR